jgi:uncharacterized SAM-binding protein YcdF (DUF218 family)
MLEVIQVAFNFSSTGTRSRLKSLIPGFLALIGLAFLLITFTPFVSWYAAQYTRPWSSERGETMVVLSAEEPDSGVMAIGAYWRCFMALVYCREYPYRRIIVSGEDSAPAMRDFFVWNGVTDDRLIVANAATNTRENAEFTATLLASEIV